MKKKHLQLMNLFVLFCAIVPAVIAQSSFIHPGLSHKKSDLDRIKYMVEAEIDPWYSSYQHMISLPTADYNYTVQGDVSITTYGLDPYGWKDSRFNGDARAAYYGALRWYIEEDERYAEKAIEAIMAWTGLTDHQQKMSLTSAPIWLMIEAAEIIRHTYDGWEKADIKKFEDMLVYPGYSTTEAPTDNYTWYWTAYKFDEARAGNQELCGVRTVAAIGVFMDNEIIYDRAMRYVSNLPAREDDLPYALGPRIQGPLNESGSNDYTLSYDIPSPENTEKYLNWGYCGVLPYNIYPNGQNVESSRDQAHTSFSLGLLCTLGEIGWNQGYNFFGLLDSRILKGLEYTLRYCVSDAKSFPDQPTPWEPVTFVDREGFEEPLAEDVSVDFIQIVNRTKRNKSQNICPDSRSGFTRYHTWELPIAHYVGRGLKTEEDLKWTIRARDYAREVNGVYEPASTGQDYTGYGALVYYRPEGCAGDPISGFSSSLPVFDMNVLPAIIEAENYDYFPINGEGRTYHDVTPGNNSGMYRDDDVDVEVCPEGSYYVSSMDDGEWMSYTVYVPTTGTYNLNVRYAASSGDGKIKFEFNGSDVTEEVTLPSTGGMTNWVTYTVADSVILSKSVQSMRVYVSGVSGSFNLNKIMIGSGKGMCALPWTEKDFTVANASANFSSGSINISCASEVSIFLDIEGSGSLETGDFLNVYYKLDDGSPILIFENKGSSFDKKTVLVKSLTGDSLQIYINGFTDSAVKNYTISNIRIIEGDGSDDIEAPTPNPATWVEPPTAISTTAISMTAITGSDISGPIEYLFEETSGNAGGNNSGWQTSPEYTDTGLLQSTSYSYTVTIRDGLGNTGIPSAVKKASTFRIFPEDSVWTSPDYIVTDTTINFSSGIFDISDLECVSISVDIESILFMEHTAYLNVYYKLDGGERTVISRNVPPRFGKKTVSVNCLSGNNLELIIDAKTSEGYNLYIKNIRIVAEDPTDVEDGVLIDIPDQFAIHQNYPNPFNPTTTISYSIAKAGNVKISVFNMLGQKVKSLVNEYKSIGRYSLSFNASELTSGVYFYSIQAEDFNQTKKMLLMK